MRVEGGGDRDGAGSSRGYRDGVGSSSQSARPKSGGVCCVIL